MHKADEIAPVVPLLDGGDGSTGALAGEDGEGGQRPDLLQDRLEPDTMLVNGPQLDARVWEGGRHRAKERTQMLLELHLGVRVSLHMARPGLQPAGAEPSQVLPAQLPADLVSEALAEPSGHRPSTPAVARRMRSGHGRSQLRQL